MIAVITGDIINSEQSNSEIWMDSLKNLLSNWGKTPAKWEVYRGDEFQIKCEAAEVFKLGLAIKSLIKCHENLDVRMGMGIGEENFSSEKITESNGSAYVNSGRLLNEIKNDGRTLSIKSTKENIDADLNMVLKWASIDFDGWTPAVAEIIHLFIMNDDITQEDIAKKLNITQSSVSQRLKRANLDLITETDRYFRTKISEL